ncbi:histidine kinase [Massilia sp. W12]|uniref:sensor histidine kinase n=1 Tax=Massilia sp. W12 TaxID=3126507 RepID=UPI0030D1584E
MPGFLQNLRSVSLYLLVWAIFGALLGSGIHSASNNALPACLFFALPAAILFGVAAGFSSYYVCRAYPLKQYHAAALALILCSAATLAGLLWTALWLALQHLLRNTWLDWLALNLTPALQIALFALGALLYLLCCALHYLAAEFEQRRDLEKRELQAQVAAQEAELRLLRSQIDPHFLFNSLNSISALTSANPAGAREMTLRLADFFRRSLHVHADRHISVAQEMLLIEDYLAIEKIRFGQRLQIALSVEPAAQSCLAPPMILQALVENAIKHGIAQLLEGGAIEIKIRTQAPYLKISVSNPVDPDYRPPRGRRGIGLENVRQRLHHAYGHTASAHWRMQAHQFQVELTLPLQTGTQDAGIDR